MKRIIAISVTLVVMFGLTFIPAKSNPPQVSRISFIDVGQGDAALLQDPNGFDVLIDGGPPEAGAGVVDYLRSKGVDSLEVMVCTHADADHVGGLVSVLQATDISVGIIYFNGYPGTTVTWGNFVNQANARSIPIVPAQFPLDLTWGDFEAHILNPVPGLSPPAQNDASVVARIDYLDTQFLFTGDISSPIEATVIARQTPVAADVLKVAHHGSAYSSSASFLAAVHPTDAVISVGENSYGHPAPETLERLAQTGAQVLRTDQMHTVLVTSDGYVVTITGQGNLAFALFLPQIIKPDEPTPPPTPTDIPATMDVRITNIYANGAGTSEPDEFVQFQNAGAVSVQLQDWTLRDNANHIFTFPVFTLLPGQVCRVYTNQVHAAHCGFSYGSASAIWNNSGDCAYLRDANGNPISQYCY